MRTRTIAATTPAMVAEFPALAGFSPAGNEVSELSTEDEVRERDVGALTEESGEVLEASVGSDRVESGEEVEESEEVRDGREREEVPPAGGREVGAWSGGDINRVSPITMPRTRSGSRWQGSLAGVWPGRLRRSRLSWVGRVYGRSGRRARRGSVSPPSVWGKDDDAGLQGRMPPVLGIAMSGHGLA
jgi:hypothetical protein